MWFENIFAAAVILVFLFICVFIYIKKAKNNKNKKYEDFVSLHSTALKTLKEINERYTFHDVPCYKVSNTYDNENFYNVISPKDFLTYSLVYRKNEVMVAIEKTEENKNLYKKYKEETDGLYPGFFDEDEPFSDHEKIVAVEKAMLEKEIKHPNTKFCINVSLCLTKINGSYCFSKSELFNAAQIEEIIERLNQKSGSRYLDEEIWQSISRVERGKVTNKMRFAVYQRDNYRCRKCGSTTDLEVDHIFPIAKGGKTTFDNLQTLCHSCNYAKSDNVDPEVLRRLRSDLNCPWCGSSLTARNGKNGPFYGCSSYPKCKYTRMRY